MRAVVCTRYGPPEVLVLKEIPIPVPRKNRGLSLNLAYRIMARLVLGWAAPRQPVLGMVLSGELESVGPDVRSCDVSDRVFGFDRHRFGTYAQYVCWPADGLLATRPEKLTDEEAAAIPYGGLLALSLLRKAGLRAGQSTSDQAIRTIIGEATPDNVASIGALEHAGLVRRPEPDGDLPVWALDIHA